MTTVELTLSVLPDTFAVCRLDKDAPILEWGRRGFFSVTRTPDELSVVCRQADVPPGTRCEGGWRCLKVEGPLDFSWTGILASLAVPLAGAGISLFAISTYETDYLLVKGDDLDSAARALAGSGHRVVVSPG